MCSAGERINMGMKRSPADGVGRGEFEEPGANQTPRGVVISRPNPSGKPTKHKEGMMTNRKLSFVGASLAVAIGIFAARMLISPAVTMAATNQGINVAQM